MDSKQRDTISIDIADQAKGHITQRDLIEAIGTVDFHAIRSELGGSNAGYLFRLKSESYRLHVGVSPTYVFIQRNHDRLEAPLPLDHNPNGLISCYITWEPSQLRIVMLDDSYREIRSKLTETADILAEIQNRKWILNTIPTLPPNSLVTWARKRSIAPTEGYPLPQDVREVVTFSIQSIQDKVRAIGLQNPFWNIEYDGNKIKSRLPKRETDIHPTIHGLLFDIAVAKNLEISPEHQIAGGNLDFLFTTSLENGSITNICIEFKNAHSKDIQRGLINQLPTYMREKGSEFGIYAVLFFKGKYFDKPRDHDLEGLEDSLESLKIKNGLSNIRIMMLDFSYQESPGKF